MYYIYRIRNILVYMDYRLLTRIKVEYDICCRNDPRAKFDLEFSNLFYCIYFLNCMPCILCICKL